MIHATAVGLEKLFLNAIFNEGELQKLYMNLSDERKLELQNSLNKFDNIYTINYDWNIEKITNGTEQGLAALIYGEKGLSSLPIQDIAGEHINTDNEYMYYYSVEFIK